MAIKVLTMPPRKAPVNDTQGYSCVSNDGTILTYILPDGKRIQPALAVSVIPESVRQALEGNCRKQHLQAIGAANAGASQQPELAKSWKKASPRKEKSPARARSPPRAKPPPSRAKSPQRKAKSPPRKGQAASRVKAQAAEAVAPAFVSLELSPLQIHAKPVPRIQQKGMTKQRAKALPAPPQKKLVSGKSAPVPAPRGYSQYTCTTDSRGRTVWKRYGKFVSEAEVPIEFVKQVKCAKE